MKCDGMHSVVSPPCHPGFVLSGHLQFIAYVSTMLGTGTGRGRLFTTSLGRCAKKVCQNRLLLKFNRNLKPFGRAVLQRSGILGRGGGLAL